jgi:PAS domain S-box-containing protein
MELDVRIAEQVGAGADPTNAQFGLLVESVSDYAIFLLDPAGRVTSWNAGAERIKGYAAADIVGRHFSLFFPAADRAAGKPEAALRRAEAEGRYHGEGWRVRKDGSRFWADVAVTALRDPGGVLRGFVKVTRDGTRQRELAQFSLLALGESSLQRVLDRAVALLGEVLKTEFVRVLEITPSGDSLTLVSGIGWKPGLIGAAQVPLQPALDESGGAMLQEHGVASGISIVISGPGAPYGVLGAHSALRRRFGAADAEFLQAVASVISAAVQRERAHERVQASEALLKAFTDNSPAAMFLKDRDGRYSFANREFLARFGLRREQVIGRSDAEVFPRRQALAFSSSDAQVLARAAPLQAEDMVRTIEGERIVTVLKFPVFDAAGAISGIGGVATDITERRRIEQTLLEQRTLLAEAQKVAGLGCWEWDPSSGRVIWSEELYRIYGTDPQTFRPSFESYLERVHADDRQHSGAMVARALMDGHGFTLEERIVRTDGSVRHLRSHGEVVRSESGRPLKLLGACLDVTDQKDSETALRASSASLQALTRRLVEAEEAERRSIARELHDQVGQNLSALNINLDIVLGALGESGPPDLRLRLRDSLELVDATLQSIENVMAELRPPLLDEYGLGAAVDWHAQEFARRTGVQADFDDRAKARARELRPEAAVALFRIAQEALNNVAKHAEAREVRVVLEEAGQSIVLTISDDGRGLLQEPASRPNRWGMTNMRERAEAAGGELAVLSVPGKGTTVRATVPL